MKQIKTIKQKFFKAFNIPANKSENAYFTGHCGEYPEITDSVLLRLMCINNSNVNSNIYDMIFPSTIKNLENNIFECLIENKHKGQIYKQVRELFGVNNDKRH